MALQMWPIVMCASWTRGVSSLGTPTQCSTTAFAFPPCEPVSATVVMPSSCAASRPLTTFAALPLVEMPSATSPGRASARSWRANTSSNE